MTAFPVGAVAKPTGEGWGGDKRNAGRTPAFLFAASTE